jgi:hypothetical protein
MLLVDFFENDMSYLQSFVEHQKIEVQFKVAGSIFFLIG